MISISKANCTVVRADRFQETILPFAVLFHELLKISVVHFLPYFDR